MTLPPGKSPPRPHNTEWREWSAKERQRLIRLERPVLADAMTTEGVESLTVEDRAAVLHYLADRNEQPATHEGQSIAVGPEGRIAGEAKHSRPALRRTDQQFYRRPQPLEGKNLPYGIAMTLRLRLRYAWPWLLPLLAIVLWAAALLGGRVWVLQHSIVG